jgi:O-antigen/teichoic acid export membrane protein
MDQGVSGSHSSADGSFARRARDGIEALLGGLRKQGLIANLLRGGGGIFVVQMLAALTAFGLHVLLARLLGPEQFGFYNYVFAWGLVLIPFARMGLDFVVVRYGAKYITQQQWGKLRGLYRSSYLLAAVFGLTAGAAMALCAALLGGRMSGALRLTFWIGALWVPLCCVSVIGRASLQSLGHAVIGFTCHLLAPKFLLLGLLALTVWGLRLSLAAPQAMGLHAASYPIAVLVAILWFRRCYARETEQEGASYEVKLWLLTGAPLMLSVAFRMVSIRASVLMTGALLDTTSAGFYSAAGRFTRFLGFGLIAINGALAPIIARLHAEGRHGKLQQMLSVAVAASFALILPMAAALAVGGPWLLGIYGQEFRVAYPAMLILIGGQVGRVMAGSAGFLLMMTGQHNYVPLFMIGGGLASVALNALLIPPLGMSGAALAAALSTILWSSGMAIFGKLRLGLDPSFMSIPHLWRGRR